MAVFVALIFQVLFVFFAMVINVGLLVHDKINLQNSVDLAAIYAAQRQAEILNTIAHSNYQIHQSWKLLAWRIRILGDVGRLSHPSNNPSNPGPYTDDIDATTLSMPPLVCVDNGLWLGTNQNSCEKALLTTPAIPTLQIAPGFTLPWVNTTAQYTAQAQQQYGRDCEELGTTNWVMAAKWLAAYKLDIANRKEIIRNLGTNLTLPPVPQPGGFKELSGGYWIEGIEKTLRANLTRANRNGLDPQKIQVFNSLQGVPMEQWLPEIFVFPLVYYTDSYLDAQRRCQFIPEILNLDGGGRLPRKFIASVDPLKTLEGALYESTDPNDLIKSIWGYEKNPWYLVYAGLKVETEPIHPFAPFGKGVKLTARSFAQPFGGRIGPWHKSQWNAGEINSSGNKVDGLAPDRYDGTGLSADFRVNVPNFSRYPGDPLGLTAQNTLAELRPFVQQGKKVSFEDYNLIPGDLFDPQGDVLARNPQNPAPDIRFYEMSGLSPDFFDAIYYSIDPNFYLNYLQLAFNQYFGASFALRPDLGFAWDGIKTFAVRDQVSAMLVTDGPNQATYRVRTAPDQFLTAWAQPATMDYSFPDTLFGQCEQPVDANYENKGISIPGSCIRGGRNGYSVKTISRDYLNQSSLELGGKGIKGGIANRPPSNF
ncbi:MAG: Tad domain-containing protein [Bdellovibrionales bacterium]